MRIPAFLLWKKPPEDSIPFRVATLASVLCGIVAVLREEEWPAYGWLVILLTIAGSGVSHLWRHRTNWGLKIVLSLLMMVALGDFVVNLVVNPYDPRVPLATLLLWLQTLHSFDLPGRRDLNYSLLVGFILVCVAGVLSHDLGQLGFLVAFTLCALACLQLNHVSRAREGAEVHGGSVPLRPILWHSLRLALALAALGVPVFLMLPRSGSMRIRPVSMSLNLKLPNLTQGRVKNPAYPETGGRALGGRQSRRFDQESYSGFTAVVDLNLRGRLSDEITMRVRSSEETYYRGLAFNEYTGEGWVMTEEQLRPHSAANPPVFLEPETGGTHEIAQIFTIEKEMANVVFAAYHPFQVFFPTDLLYTDRHSGVRAPFPLQPGMVYSVVSLTREASPLALRRLGRSLSRGHRRRDFVRRAVALDTSLPGTVPARVRDLAREITRNQPNSLARAQAIAQYLKTRYTYTLDVPPFPPGADVADAFLFEYRRGYCEHFATAMTVLCRAAGIPARYVTGYLPGTYNPFTGYYEVKCSDAHAWVEAMIDPVGWISFDPTPGFEGLALGASRERSPWVLGSLMAYLQQQLGLDGASLGSLAPAAVAWVAAIVGSLARAGGVGWGLLGMGGVLCALALAAAIRGMLRAGRRVQAALTVMLEARGTGGGGVLARVRGFLARSSGPAPPADGRVSAWETMARILAERGCARQAWQTPGEFADAACERFPAAATAIRTLADRYARACFREEPVTPEDAEETGLALEALDRAMQPPADAPAE